MPSNAKAAVVGTRPISAVRFNSIFFSSALTPNCAMLHFWDISGDGFDDMLISYGYSISCIGGSYLGARAVIGALNHQFASLIPGDDPLVLYAGQNIGE